ncbi:MAG: VacJ family lipoprotein [Alphaproteobacteria bacterium]|nr:VacJ family lipoprotein [Alphaproteobacteria bacterium]
MNVNGKTQRSWIAGLIGVLLLAGCAGTTVSEGAKPDIPDPLEPLNRSIFAVNLAFDAVVLRPVAETYREIVPEPGQRGVRNFLDNLQTPVTLANDLFQGQLDRAGTTVARFLINSTVGIGGLLDVARSMGYERNEEDFGQTLGYYGIEPGFYLMLPILGPSSARDAIGLGFDYFLDPLNYYARNTDRHWITYLRLGPDGVDARARSLDTLDDIERTSTDFYASIRSIYRQRREALVRNGTPPKLPE